MKLLFSHTIHGKYTLALTIKYTLQNQMSYKNNTVVFHRNKHMKLSFK